MTTEARGGAQRKIENSDMTAMSSQPDEAFHEEICATYSTSQMTLFPLCASARLCG